MVLLSDKHPIDLTIGQELPPTFHYAWVILAFDVYRDTAGQCVSCTPYSCHRDNFAGDSRLTGPEDRTMSDSYEFATHTPLGFAGERTAARAEFNHVRWISHCRGMVQLPAAA